MSEFGPTLQSEAIEPEAVESEAIEPEAVESEPGDPEVVVDFNDSDENDPQKPANRVVAVGKIVAGAVVAAAGVPMLVLPGPGLAAIAVGGFAVAKGISELKGEENPVIAQIEGHPEYQAATQKAKDATGAVADAAADAAKQVPGIMVSAGKVMLDAAYDNLPENARDAVDRTMPKIKGATEAAAATAEAAAPKIKSAAKTAAPVVDAVGEGVMEGLKALGSFAKGVLERK